MIDRKKCIVCGRKATKERIIGGKIYGFCKNHGVWDYHFERVLNGN